MVEKCQVLSRRPALVHRTLMLPCSAIEGTMESSYWVPVGTVQGATCVQKGGFQMLTLLCEVTRVSLGTSSAL